jgi:hypothetical protein
MASPAPHRPACVALLIVCALLHTATAYGQDRGDAEAGPAPAGSEPRGEPPARPERTGGERARDDLGTEGRAEDPKEQEHGGRFIEELTYEQQPGLPPAASKIFFSERKYAISGFGELAYVQYLGDKNTASEDIELFYTNLYRFVLYGAYRPVKWLVLYAEVFAEFFHDGFQTVDYEFFPEVFMDFLITRGFNLRVGWAQVPIGFINNNDEPIMFYSVNRPEVERLIIPSQWIDLGVMAYGTIAPKLTYMMGVFQGVDGEELLGGTWIRRGRELRFNFRSVSVAGQLNYEPIENLSLSVSGVFTEAGNRAQVDVDGEQRRVKAPTGLLSAYARYEIENWTFMVLGAVGWMAETELLFDLTGQRGERAEVLGATTYGVYFEIGVDILPYFRDGSGDPKRTWLYRTDEFKLPLFVRYERLDTHARVDPALASRLPEGAPIFRSNLDVVTVGVNFNPRKNLVAKVNYQFRRNRQRAAYLPEEGDRLEFGLGFIF